MHLSDDLFRLDIGRVLERELTRAKLKNPRYSLRAFARRLDISPSLLSMVIQGKRSLPDSATRKLADILNHSGDVRSYLLNCRSRPTCLTYETRLGTAQESLDPCTHLEIRRGENWYEQAYLRLTEHPKALLLGMAPMVSDMTQTWHGHGFAERGLNTWVMPDIFSHDDPVSRRYDPDSLFYQSLTGIFTIPEFEFASDWRDPNPRAIARSVERFFGITLFAQMDWVRHCGGSPRAPSMVAGSLQIEPWAEGYFRCEFLADSYSDYGADDPRLPLQPSFARFADRVAPFHPVRFHVSAFIKCDPESRTLVIIYAGCAEFERKDGSKGEPSPYFKWQMTSLLDALRVKKAIHSISP